MPKLTKTAWFRALTCQAIAGYVRLIRATGSWHIEGEHIPRSFWHEGKPFIGAFWHGRAGSVLDQEEALTADRLAARIGRFLR